MAEQVTVAAPAPKAPGVFTPAARLWQRVSPSLVPILAVLTALIITVPFMIVTGGQGDFGRGLNIAGTAYTEGWSRTPPYQPPSCATGVGVRLLVELARRWSA